jgi:hypothetical protein
MKQWKQIVAAGICVGISCALAHGQTVDKDQSVAPTIAKGVVFHDANGNQKLDPGEKRLPGVRVSNGHDVTTTNEEGKYQLPIDDDAIIFVLKPRGWRSPLSDANLPRFYYIHKPNGSPKAEFAGVPPTGPLPESVDFPLSPQDEPDKFKAIILGDTQTRDRQEVAYLAHDILEELIGTDALFGVTLGDVAFNDLSIYEPQIQAVSKVGIPWHNVIGNHDTNFDAKQPRHSDETFERYFGPSHYSFDYGPAHFVVLDDIEVSADPKTGEPSLKVKIGQDQIEFLKNDLAGIPQKQLVVLMMHVPILEVQNRESVYRLIENRLNCFSMCGHTHSHEHHFIGPKDGWRGEKPLHLIIQGTACGCWWCGCPDERGIPIATMGDGVPNGYSIITFDGNRYSQEYKVAGRGKDYQMLIEAPDDVPAAETAKTKILVNVFNSSPRSTVKMRIEDGKWLDMKPEKLLDPAHCKARESDERLKEKTWKALSRSFPSTHIWTALLPANIAAGFRRIEVETIDMNGKKFTGYRLIRIVGPSESTKDRTLTGK